MPIVNPHVVLREEFDDWAILFNPDAALGFGGFGLNPTGVYLWKLLDGKHTIDDLLAKLRGRADGVPGDAQEHIRVFVDALVGQGLAVCGNMGAYWEKCSCTPPAAVNEAKANTYEPPKLVNLDNGQAAQGSTCSNHGSNGNYCCGGSMALGDCVGTGSCPSNPGMCYPGSCASNNCSANGSNSGKNCGCGTSPFWANYCNGGNGNGFGCCNGTSAGSPGYCGSGTGA